MLSRFHLIPERYGRTNRRTDLLLSRVSMLTRDKISPETGVVSVTSPLFKF